jgi:hypothetical protein
MVTVDPGAEVAMGEARRVGCDWNMLVAEGDGAWESTWVKEGGAWVKEGGAWEKEGRACVKEGRACVKEGVVCVKECGACAGPDAPRAGLSDGGVCVRGAWPNADSP